MNNKFLIFIILLGVSFVSSCGPNRQDADAKLKESCLEALRSVYESNDTVEPQETSFESKTTEDGDKLRVVKIRAYYSHDKGMIEEKNYSCSFSETRDFFGYQAHFYSMDRAGVKYGTFDGVAEGDFNDLLRLNAILDHVMGGS